MPQKFPIFALAAALLAAGCGIKGNPELVSDRDDRFPRTYPEGAVPSVVVPPGIYIERYRER